MLQRYKLRLGDGSLLQVDQDGLRAWLTDGRATVQVAGTQEWRPLREFLADEDSAARLARALVPPEPRRAPAPAPPEGPSPIPSAEPAIGEPSMVQALAEEPSVAGSPAPPWRESRSAADEAPIRLRPLDEEPPRYAVPWARRAEEGEAEEGGEEDQDRRYDRLEGPLLLVLSTFGALLSRCLDPLTRLARSWPSTSVDKPVPRRSARVEGRSDRGLPERVSEWVSGVRGWVGRQTDRIRPEPHLPPAEPATKVPRAPTPRVPLEAPPPISELPALRLAEVHEAREAEDVYEGEEAESRFPALWIWTKRIVLVAVLLGGGVIAALNWRTWFPRAAELGQTVFTEIDRQARSGQRTEEQQRALREAAERLPHLMPETIHLILATSRDGVLDPPEVFQLASEAADRGLPALTSAEVAELQALQRELLSHLRPPERARLAEYESARTRRVVFSFENPHALELVARAARAMPSGNRQRLQALLGKAVAAGLGAPAASP